MLVKKINNLELDIQKTPYKYWLNIIKKFKDSETGYVICGFEYNETENYYYLESTAGRIADVDINWNDLEALIKFGFEILTGEETLEEMYNRLVNLQEIIEEEPEIDIQSIEELEIIEEIEANPKDRCTHLIYKAKEPRLIGLAVNQLIKAVKQLDHQINNK